MRMYSLQIFSKKAGRALKSTLFAIILSAAVVFETFGAVLPEEPVAMEVIYGYQNIAKSGRFLPLKIQLENKESQTFEGTLCILALEPDFQSYNGRTEYGVYRYEYPVTLQEGESLEKNLSISLGTRVDQMYVSLVNASGQEIGRKRLKLNLNLDTAELFVGILSSTPDKLLYLNNVGINYSTLRTRIIQMTAENFPSDELGLDQLDVLLINGFDTSTLSRQQIDAVWEWVYRGGTLLLGTGAEGKKTLQAFSGDLWEEPVSEPELMEVNMGVEYAVDRPQEASIPLMCTEIMLDGGSELLSSDELSVLSSVSKGSGMVAVAAYDFKDIEEFCQKNIAYVDNLFVTLLGEDKINRLSSGTDSGSSAQFWSVQGLINNGNLNKLPKVELYVMLAVSYVILAGPGLYFFLKQRNLRKYYQPSVALLSLCCTGLVLFMGEVTRFKGPFFTYASIRDADRDQVLETTFINMRAPYNKPYSVVLDSSYSLHPMTGSPYYDRTSIPQFTGEEKPDITIHYGEAGTKIQAGNIGAFHSRFFQLEKSHENQSKEGFTGNISAFDGKITGTLTNHYNQTVEDVAVILYNQMVLIDKMEPGETVDLDQMEILYGVTNLSYATAAQITGAFQVKQNGDIRDEKYAQTMERANLLTFYIENYLSGYHAQARVVGFSSDKENTQFLQDDRYETYGSTLLTSALDVNYEKDHKIYRSAMQKQPKVLSGEYYGINNTIYGLAPVILEYYLGNDIEVEKLGFHQSSQQMEDNLKYYYMMVPFTGGMYFYNYNTGNYDPMDISVTEYSRELLEPYLSPGNTLTVKYVYDTTGDYTWNIMLPVLTVTGRSK